MKSQAASFKKSEFNVQDFPMVHIAAIHKAYNVTLANEFRSFDVTPQMWRILVTLQAKDGYSLGHLAEITLIEQSHLSRLIDTMENDRLVKRQAQNRDRRIRLVKITAKGQSLFEDLLPIVMSQYDKILAGFDKQEISKLMEFLGRLRVNLK
jgi:MarR family transcriptional regulator, organic hydroperoxide resistance regulator